MMVGRIFESETIHIIYNGVDSKLDVFELHRVIRYKDNLHIFEAGKKSSKIFSRLFP